MSPLKKRVLIPLLLLVLSVIFCSVNAEEPGEAAEVPVPGNEMTDMTALVLLTDDGFTSVTTQDGVTVPDAAKAFITVSELMDTNLIVRGPNTKDKSTNLLYETANQETNDWELSNDGIRNQYLFIRTMNGLRTYSYNRLIVLTGPMSQNASQDISDGATFPHETETLLYQLAPSASGFLLQDQYMKCLKIDPDMTGSELPAGFSRLSSAPAELYGKIAEEGSVTGEGIVDDLLTQIYGLERLDVETEDGSCCFELPASLMKKCILVIETGDNSGSESTESVELPSEESTETSAEQEGTGIFYLCAPDGGKWKIGEQDDPQNKAVRGRKQRWGAKERRFVPLHEFMNGNSGKWTIQTEENVTAIFLYYLPVDDYQELLDQAEMLTPHEETAQKSYNIYSVSENQAIQDLFRLYPELRLKVTDTQNGDIVNEVTADDANKKKIQISFATSGEHTLTFRLMNGENEILASQTTVNVPDQPLIFNLSEDEREFLIHPDTLDEPFWTVSTSNWFTDADETDTITVKTALQTDSRVTYDENQKELRLDLSGEQKDETITVVLEASSDASKVRESITLSLRSLKDQFEGLNLKPDIKPVKDGTTPGKRTSVRLKATVNNHGVDEEDIKALLTACDATVYQEIPDDNNQPAVEVAKAQFDSDNWSFTSDEFILPDKAGSYRWELKLTPKGTKNSDWSTSDKTVPMTIDNHAPVIDSAGREEVEAQFKTEYVYQTNAVKFTIPGNLAADPDQDPVTYVLKIVNPDSSNAPENETSFNLTEDEITSWFWSPAEFGKYRLEISARDNDDAVSAVTISGEIELINVCDIINELTAVVTMDDNYAGEKREQITLTWAIDTDGWSNEKENAVREWMKACDANVTRDDHNDTVSAAFSEPFSFSATVTTAEHEGTYTYSLTLKKSDNQPSEQEATKELEATQTVVVVNHRPEIVAEPTDNEVWIMSADEFSLVIPDGYMKDPDEDTNLTYSMKLVKVTGDDETMIMLPEDNQDQRYTLPYTFHFPEMNFFSFTETYRAEITCTDNDGSTETAEETVVLHNKKLLIYTIIAGSILLLLIAAAVIFMMYRRRLPAFKGEVYFRLDHGNDKKCVSSTINLAEWKKQKHLPLTTFAGLIEILLTDEQWEQLSNYELRPNHANGYLICGIDQKKADESAEEPELGRTRDGKYVLKLVRTRNGAGQGN